MNGWAQVFIILGITFLLGSVFFMIMAEPHYPVPMAICGAGFFIGGSVLGSRGRTS